MQNVDSTVVLKEILSTFYFYILLYIQEMFKREKVEKHLPVDNKIIKKHAVF